MSKNINFLIILLTFVVAIFFVSPFAYADCSFVINKISGDGAVIPINTSHVMTVKVILCGEPADGATVSWIIDASSSAQGQLFKNIDYTDSNGLSSNTITLSTKGTAIIKVTAKAVLDIGDGYYEEYTATTFFSINGFSEEEEEEEVGAFKCEECAHINPKAKGAEGDLYERCIEQCLSDKNNANIQKQIDFEEVAIEGTSAIETANIQFTNIGSRLTELRKGSTGASIKGLSFKLEDYTLPLLASSAAPETVTDGSMPTTSEELSELGMFLTGTLKFGDKDRTSKERGFDFDTKGISGGIDYRLIKPLFLGIAFGYASTDSDFQQSPDSFNIDGYTASFYGNYNITDNLYIDSIISHSWVDMEMERHVFYSIPSIDKSITLVNQNFKSDPDGTILSSSIGSGYDFSVNGLYIGPYIRLDNIECDIDKYRERPSNLGPGHGLALTIEDQDVHSFTGTLGLNASHSISTNWAVLLPHIRFEALHEFDNDARDINAYPTTNPVKKRSLSTERPDRDYITLGMGLTAIFPGGKMGFIDYEPVLGLDDVTAHKITLGLRIEF